MAKQWNVLDWPNQSPDLSPTVYVSLAEDQTESQKQGSLISFALLKTVVVLHKRKRRKRGNKIVFRSFLVDMLTKAFIQHSVEAYLAAINSSKSSQVSEHLQGLCIWTFYPMFPGKSFQAQSYWMGSVWELPGLSTNVQWCPSPGIQWYSETCTETI